MPRTNVGSRKAGVSVAALKPFRSGDTIGIFAPSGVLPEPDKLTLARANLESLGFKVRIAEGTLDREGYCAGSLETRRKALESLVDDPEVGLIMAARGGFGLSHLLPHVNWTKCRAAQKYFCGFSDFTAFHLGYFAKTSGISLAGPMAVSDFGGPSISPLHADHLFGRLAHPELAHPLPVFQSDQDHGQQTLRGPLWGGNLSLLTHLVGTPYCPRIDGGLLFLEDIGEAPYRIERMLLQLEFAGLLQTQKAILLGAFTGSEPPSTLPVRYTLDEVIAALRARFAGPVITGLPFGHIKDKVTLPFGGEACVKLHHESVEITLAPMV